VGFVVWVLLVELFGAEPAEVPALDEVEVPDAGVVGDAEDGPAEQA
jgi:hypothetical protein